MNQAGMRCAVSDKAAVYFEGGLRRRNRVRVLVSTDLDETLALWHKGKPGCHEQLLSDNAEVLKRHRSQLAVHVTTGRGLTSMKTAAPFLKDVPIDYLSLNNGQELYINWQQQPADQWIAGLTTDSQARFWRKTLKKQIGWSSPQVGQTIQQVLMDQGFVVSDNDKLHDHHFKDFVTYAKTLPDGVKLVVSWFEDQPMFALREAPAEHPKSYGYNPAYEQYGQTLLDEVATRLRAQGAQIKTVIPPPFSPEDTFRLFVIAPEGVDKAVGAQGLIRHHLPALRGVITAGDHPYNDGPLLLNPFYIKRPFRIFRRPVPNYPILSGDRHDVLNNPFSQGQVPNGIQTPIGQLAPALETQIRRIQGQ